MNTKFENILLVECDLGGPKAGAACGPRALHPLLNPNINLVEAIDTPINRCRESLTPRAHFLKEINECISRISNSVFDFFTENPEKRLGVVAGDHSTACGTLSGLKRSFPDSRIGVVWIDAHADIHSPFTSPSGNVHGMPIAAATGLDHNEMAINTLGCDEKMLWENTKAIAGSSFTLEDLVYIGIRDLEEQEWNILNEHQIPNFSVSKVAAKGGIEIAKDALKLLNKCDLIYVSFDIDSLDASLVPGTGTPVSDGLNAIEVVEMLSVFSLSEKVKLIEVAEINPLLDNQNETADLVAQIMEGIF